MSEKDKSNGGSERAGLVYAPAYDASQDMDPDDAPVVTPVRDDVKSLAYYQDLERQRSFKLRMTLIALVCAMMIAIMCMRMINISLMIPIMF